MKCFFLCSFVSLHKFILPAATSVFVFHERWAYFSKHGKTTQCFEHTVAFSSKPDRTEAVSFILSVFFIKEFNSTIRYCSFKKGDDQILKTTGLVLLRLEIVGLRTEILTCLRSCCFGLTHRVRNSWLE